MIVESPQDLAHGINHQLRMGLTPRPWNLFKPSDTFYWLVPSTDWPAYRHGKFAFSMTTDHPRKALLGIDDALLHTEEFFAGLNIEKGFGEMATAVDPTLRRKKQIMDAGWLWFDVVDRNGAARFGRMLAAVSHTASLELFVVSSYVHDREDDTRPEQDAIMFSCHSSGISSVLHNRFPVGVLRGVEEITNFVALADRLSVIDDYHWVDMYVGTHVRKGDLDLDDLHARFLSHFQPWVVEAPEP
jgi:hypothetical protein